MPEAHRQVVSDHVLPDRVLPGKGAGLPWKALDVTPDERPQRRGCACAASG